MLYHLAVVLVFSVMKVGHCFHFSENFLKLATVSVKSGGIVNFSVELAKLRVNSQGVTF